MGFKEIIHGLDEFFHCGDAITKTVDKLVEIANNMAINLSSVTVKSNALIEEIKTSLHHIVVTFPKIVNNLNISIIEFNDLLYWIIIAIIVCIIVTVCSCLIQSISAYHNIYGIKKVIIVNKSESNNDDNQIIKEKIITNNHSKQLNQVTIDIKESNAGSGPNATNP